MSFAQKTLALLTVINSLPRLLGGGCAPYISTQCILFYSENEDGVFLHTDHEENNANRIAKEICDLEFPPQQCIHGKITRPSHTIN